ncbi:MAG: exodeoxyribonuclease VII small subunit [Rikenellaceae bacterium]|nr:exodeoxyribonuclease VII small subunit [Rikenellaceae bacterium]
MAKKKLTYAEAMAELEGILARLRSDELSVDDLAKSVARATELIAECRAILTTTEEEVEKLVNSEA